MSVCIFTLEITFVTYYVEDCADRISSVVCVAGDHGVLGVCPIRGVDSVVRHCERCCCSMLLCVWECESIKADDERKEF